VIGFGLTVAALLVAGLVAIAALGALRRDVHDNVARAADVGRLLAVSHDATLRLVALAQADLMGGTARRDAADSLSELADSVRRALVLGAQLSDEERARLERIGGLQGRIEVRLAVARAYRDLGRLDDAFRQAALGAATLDSLFDESAAIAVGQERHADAALATIDALVARRRTWLRALLAAGALAALAFGTLTWRAVTRPLDRIVAAARTLGGGDLRAAVPTTGWDREYLALAVAFNETAERLRRVVADVQSEAESVHRAADGLDAAADQAADSTGQISSVVANVAREAEAQRLTLAEAADMLRDTQARAAALDGAAQRSREAGWEIRSTALRSRTSVAGAVDTLSRAQTVIGSSSQAVARLEVASVAIEQFVAAVRRVADQTQLLSLNAAIEAARAGESGRGFAVVAEEVRKLAEHSAAAAAEVQDVVDAMRRQVEEAADAFKRGVAGLGDVSDVSRATATALQAIDDAVTRVEDVAGAVSQAADATRVAVRTLGDRVGATAAQAEAQAAAGEQAAAAAQQTAATSQEVAATAHGLQQSAARLRALVAGFRV
jgi:methyl-accepting chemotaxis protein